MPALGYVWRCDWQGNFSTKHLRARWNIFVLIKAKLGSNDPSLFIDHFLSFPLRFGQISRIVSSLEDSDWPVRQLFIYLCNVALIIHKTFYGCPAASYEKPNPNR